jgi:hypothetical protein
MQNATTTVVSGLLQACLEAGIFSTKAVVRILRRYMDIVILGMAVDI